MCHTAVCHPLFNQLCFKQVSYRLSAHLISHDYFWAYKQGWEVAKEIKVRKQLRQPTICMPGKGRLYFSAMVLKSIGVWMHIL